MVRSKEISQEGAMNPLALNSGAPLPTTPFGSGSHFGEGAKGGQERRGRRAGVQTWL